MSFTEDELQAFNTILDQRLSAQRKEMERFFDQRILEATRENEQRFFIMQQELVRNVTLKLTEMQGRLDSMVSEKLQVQHTRTMQSINLDADQRSQKLESGIARGLETQLSAMEQLLNRQFEQLTQQSLEETVMTANGMQPLETFEVQTEIPWEDLSDMIGKALDERLSALSEAISRSLQNLEQYLSVRIHGLRDEFVRTQSQPGTLNGTHTSVQEVLHGIEHLERVVESMQVAMTANHALLSNRLYHHQQLPLERAHPGGHSPFTPGNGQANALTTAKDHTEHDPEPEPAGNVKVEEHEGL
jgi:hypothetical protein